MFPVETSEGRMMVRPAQDVTVGGRMAVTIAIARVGVTRMRAMFRGDVSTGDPAVDAAEDARLEALSDAVAWACLDGWDLPGNVPGSPAGFAALDGPLRAAVADAVAGEGSRLVATELGLR